jgi:phosphatidylinositol glycan class V
MLFCARRQWLLATASFASASAFRSNGALLAGFIIWGVAVEPLVARRQVIIQAHVVSK